MTKEDKSLLLKDLSERMSYGVICSTPKGDGHLCSINQTIFGTEYGVNIKATTRDYFNDREVCIKPYLRSVSSMTEEEKEELLNLLFDKEDKHFYIDEEGSIDGKTSDLMKEGLNYPAFCPFNIVLYTDWLKSHHFDYRGLIPKGFALEAPKNMYTIK